MLGRTAEIGQYRPVVREREIAAFHIKLAFAIYNKQADQMQPSDYPTVGVFRNDTDGEMRLYLEMVAEEVVLGPGHSVELLAKPTPNLLPLTIDYVAGGLQIHPNKEFDPDWHVRFNGQVIRAGHPTKLKEYE